MEYTTEIINITKIREGLFIGDRIAGTNLDVILQFKISHIINAAGSQIINQFETIGVKYLTLNWSESPVQNLFDKKDEIAERIVSFIDDSFENGEGLLAHSVRGQDRVCVLICIYLMQKYNWTLVKCLDFLKSKKQDVEIPQFFIQQLANFETRLNKQPKNKNKSADWSVANLVDDDEALMRNTYINGLPARKVKPNVDPTQIKTKKCNIGWADNNPYGRPNYLIVVNAHTDLLLQSNIQNVVSHMRIRPKKGCIKKTPAKANIIVLVGDKQEGNNQVNQNNPQIMNKQNNKVNNVNNRNVVNPSIPPNFPQNYQNLMEIEQQNQNIQNMNPNQVQQSPQNQQVLTSEIDEDLINKIAQMNANLNLINLPTKMGVKNNGINNLNLMNNIQIQGMAQMQNNNDDKNIRNEAILRGQNKINNFMSDFQMGGFGVGNNKGNTGNIINVGNVNNMNNMNNLGGMSNINSLNNDLNLLRQPPKQQQFMKGLPQSKNGQNLLKQINSNGQSLNEKELQRQSNMQKKTNHQPNQRPMSSDNHNLRGNNIGNMGAMGNIVNLGNLGNMGNMGGFSNMSNKRNMSVNKEQEQQKNLIMQNNMAVININNMNNMNNFYNTQNEMQGNKLHSSFDIQNRMNSLGNKGGNVGNIMAQSLNVNMNQLNPSLNKQLNNFLNGDIDSMNQNALNLMNLNNSNPQSNFNSTKSSSVKSNSSKRSGKKSNQNQQQNDKNFIPNNNYLIHNNKEIEMINNLINNSNAINQNNQLSLMNNIRNQQVINEQNMGLSNFNKNSRVVKNSDQNKPGLFGNNINILYNINNNNNNQMNLNMNMNIPPKNQCKYKALCNIYLTFDFILFTI